MPVTPGPLHPLESLTRSEEHTSELQSLRHLVCRLLLEKKNPQFTPPIPVPLLPRPSFHARCPPPCRPDPPPRTSGRARRCRAAAIGCFCFFFFNDTAPPEIYPLSLHDALPISRARVGGEVETRASRAAAARPPPDS